MTPRNTLNKNEIVVASITDSMNEPLINKIEGFESYTVLIKEPKILRGMDSVELRVLDFDEDKKIIKVSFHAMDKFNSTVSTPRAIFVTYQSMQNTVAQIFRKLF